MTKNNLNFSEFRPHKSIVFSKSVFVILLEKKSLLFQTDGRLSSSGQFLICHSFLKAFNIFIGGFWCQDKIYIINRVKVLPPATQRVYKLII